VAKATDIRVVGATLYFLPVKTRVPLKFGTETTTQVTCARVCVKVSDRRGRTAEGWGETPLSVQWVWPAAVSYEERHDALKQFCIKLTRLWVDAREMGHPFELGHDFHDGSLKRALKQFNATQRARKEPMPWLAALVCSSAFDIALHDAFGQLLRRPTYSTYTAQFMNRDLASYLQPVKGSGISFAGKFPADFLIERPPTKLAAWHLVGGVDLLDKSELTGKEPKDDYPLLLKDWIRKDGLKCLKVKLRGNDPGWDFERLTQVGKIAAANGVLWLSADFNCTVSDPQYVNIILDRFRDDYPALYGMILYVEQPFPYELEEHPIDVHSVSARKPLFLDESAHSWQLIRLGRELGWTGVALKTCKTQTGALLSACWAKAHGMTLMVQDLTNPMLAQIPHVLLAAHAGTIMGVETNAMQFYPEASSAEAKVHPGLYRRSDGMIDLSSLGRKGFGYKLDKIERKLPIPAAIE
jgi:L-alanine-DL-glutamate epimerase-like enolase superfamily enzyme